MERGTKESAVGDGVGDIVGGEEARCHEKWMWGSLAVLCKIVVAES